MWRDSLSLPPQSFDRARRVHEAVMFRLRSIAARRLASVGARSAGVFPPYALNCTALAARAPTASTPTPRMVQTRMACFATSTAYASSSSVAAANATRTTERPQERSALGLISAHGPSGLLTPCMVPEPHPLRAELEALIEQHGAEMLRVRLTFKQVHIPRSRYDVTALRRKLRHAPISCFSSVLTSLILSLVLMCAWCRHVIWSFFSTVDFLRSSVSWTRRPTPASCIARGSQTRRATRQQQQQPL